MATDDLDVGQESESQQLKLTSAPSRSPLITANTIDARTIEEVSNIVTDTMTKSSDDPIDGVDEIEPSDLDINRANDLAIGSVPNDAEEIVSNSALSTGQILSPVNLLNNRQANITLASEMETSSDKSKTNLFRRSRQASEIQSGINKIEVSWRNLVYDIERSNFSPTNCFSSENGRSMIPKTKRTILKGLCGYFRTGELTAVMGPSGSGKSTLLECIVGFRKRGLSGDIRVSGVQGESTLKVALISQSDYLIETFTVREMLIYASRLKNYSDKEADVEDDVALEEVVAENNSTNLNGTDSSSKGNLLNNEKVKNYHQRLALKVVHQLGLDVCVDTRAASCSGGQKKRISIALEMISRPNILILDEPTSGLDSSACYQTVSLMQKLTKDNRYPIAIVATIHQPSARVFNLFDHIYIISNNGHCIYQGSTQNMLATLASVDLNCPQFHNPADFIAEIASGEHGTEAINRLTEVKQRQDFVLQEQMGSDRTLTQYSEMHNYPKLLHLWILLQRTILHIMRDPMLNTLRFASHVLTAVFIGVLYGDSIGKPELCPPLVSPLNDLETFPEYRSKYQIDTVTITENLAYIFFTLMFILFGSMMPTIMTFPANLFVLRKEKVNGWYSVANYYMALSLAEIPFQIIYPMIFVAISYYMTGQLMEVNRLALFILINVLMAFIAQSQGLLLGAIFMEDASAAVFLGPISTVPIMLFAGFFVRIETIPYYLRYFSYISYMRYAFESSLSALYGFGRCYADPELLSQNVTKPGWMSYATMILGEGGDQFIDKFAKSIGGTYDPSLGKRYQSSILNQFEVSDDDFMLNIGKLLAFFVVMRIFTYFILAQKINKRD